MSFGRGTGSVCARQIAQERVTKTSAEGRNEFDVVSLYMFKNEEGVSDGCVPRINRPETNPRQLPELDPQKLEENRVTTVVWELPLTNGKRLADKNQTETERLRWRFGSYTKFLLQVTVVRHLTFQKQTGEKVQTGVHEELKQQQLLGQQYQQALKPMPMDQCKTGRHHTQRQDKPKNRVQISRR